LILQIIYLNRALRKGWHLSSYRTEAGAEVDLVIEREDDILGIEVKSGRTISRGDTRGLLSLEQIIGRYKPLRKWIVYGGDRRQLLENDLHIFPYVDALEELGESRP